MAHPPVCTPAIPRAALCSSYSLWLHWCSSAARTASRHRSRNASAPSQKHSRAKAPEPLAMHALSAKSYRLDDSRGQRLKRAWDKSIIDENEHVFVYMVRFMPRERFHSISFLPVLFTSACCRRGLRIQRGRLQCYTNLNRSLMLDYDHVYVKRHTKVLVF